MECDTEEASVVCWFCRKGRHADCMGTVPVQAGSEGPHDCTFDSKMVPCSCTH